MGGGENIFGMRCERLTARGVRSGPVVIRTEDGRRRTGITEGGITAPGLRAAAAWRFAIVAGCRGGALAGRALSWCPGEGSGSGGAT